MGQLTGADRMRAAQGTTAYALLAALAITTSGTALAQDAGSTRVAQANTAATDDTKLENVVVTGSRIVRGGFEAPTPVSVVGADRIEQRAATNVGDLLNELPSFRATATPAAGGLGTGLAGYYGGRQLDLRGLGAVRTLVLVDGKRYVPSTTISTVDVNMVPTPLLERAEVVTGGASAQYGSDAVAGVVNFILNERLNGVRSEVGYGQSSRSDNKTTSASLAGGTDIFSGRGHFVGSAEFEKDDGVGTCTVRAWCAEGWLNFGNTPAGTGGRPANNILPDVNPSTISPTGVINSPNALHGITFNPDGSPRRFVYGSLVNSLFQVGGEGHGQDGYFEGVPIVSPTERYLAYTRTRFDFTDTLTGRLDLSYGHLIGYHEGTEYRNVAMVIKRDNPFLPASTDPTLDVPGIMDANGITQFNLGKNFADIGNPHLLTTNGVFRAVASLKGVLAGSWTWDAYYQFGRNDFETQAGNTVINANLARAVDAVRNPAGQAVCRVNADASTTNDDPRCVALNPFGQQLSAALINYVTGTSVQTDVTKENVVAGNVQGELFSTWAGPVSLAGGVEYRNDQIDGTADPISRALGFFSNNAANINGKVSVEEGYLETLVPLAKDMTFARNLELNGAARRTHYDRSSPATGSSGVSTTTWKAGLVWEPVASLRLRGTRSRDIRAPNVSELFGPNTTGFGILNDPANGGKQTNPVVVSGSNAILVPEVGDTWTGGFVIQPAVDNWLGRVQMSVDYYDIDLKNAIGNLGAQTIATRCAAGATEFCDLITRDATNTITQINDVLLNVNEQITRGVDLEIAYRQPLASLGTLDLRLLGTYVSDLITIDSAGPVNRAGQTGLRAGTAPGIPKYTVDFLANWVDGPLTLSLHSRFVAAGLYNAAFLGPDQPGYNINLPTSSNNNHVKAATYFDLVGSYEFGHTGVSAYAGVDNIFDVDPPRVPGANGTGNNVLFDPVGRMWKLGLRYKQ
jgi:iron complex outermembrane recepter protein